MRTLGVVLLEPRRDHDEGRIAAGEPMMPEALLLQRPEEPLDPPVLLRRIGGDVLLVEAVAPHGVHEDLGSKHEPVVEDRRVSGVWPYSIRRSRSASSRAAAAIRVTPDRDRPPVHERPIAAVDNRRRVAPVLP